MKSKNIDIYNIVLKLEQLYQNEIDILNDKSPFSNAKLKNAEIALTTIMANFVKSRDKVIKINKILRFQNCTFYNYSFYDFYDENKPDKIICKYAILKIDNRFGEYFVPDNKKIVCNSCKRRKEELEDIIFMLHSDAKKQITPEIIKIKAIINLMNSKIKKFINKKS